MAAGGSSVLSRLEPELWSKGDAHVVVRTTVEENVVADFGTKADRSGKGFKSTARIDREISRSGAQTHRIHEARWRS
jgi:hypothetical protein